MKIALLHNHVGGKAGGGGGVRLMVELAQALERLGHRVTIACHDHQAGAEFAAVADRLDIRAVRTGQAGFPEGQKAMADRYWRGMAKVARLVPDDVDVVNSHEWPGLRGGLLAGRRLGVPVVWTRNDESIFERATVPDEAPLGDPRPAMRLRNGLLGVPDLLAARSAAAVVVLAERQARMVERSFRRPADVVPMGPPERFYDPPARAEARRRLGVPDGAFLVVGASILFPHRRFEDLIEAAALARDEPRLRVLIAGSDHSDRAYADRLEALIAERGLGDRVSLPRESVSDAELLDAYTAADVFVYPNQLQTWGLAPLEALAAGTPAIVSSGAGVAELLDGRPGVRIVPPEDPPAIAAALREALASDWRAEVEPTREWMRRELSAEGYARRMVSIYERVTGAAPHNLAASNGFHPVMDDRKGSVATRVRRAVTRARLGARERLPETVTIDAGGPPYRYRCESVEEYQRALSLTWKEPGTFRFLHEELRAGDVFYDIGANMGIYTVPAAHTVGESGHVFAFEPHVGNVRSLLQNVGANRLTERVTVISSALHERSGFFDFNYSDWTPGTAMSQLDGDRDPFGHDLNAVGAELKYATTVDELIASGVIRPATAIKIDVDGNELPILRGMRGLLTGADRPRVVQVEVNPEEREQLAGYMGEVGFELADRHYTEGAERMLQAGDDPDSVPYNAIFR